MVVLVKTIYDILKYMEKCYPKVLNFVEIFLVFIFLFLFSNSTVNAQFSASFTDPTPPDGSTVNSDPTIKVSTADPSQHYVLNNFDSSLVGWWRGENNGNDESGLGNTGVPISTDSSYTKVNTSSGIATADDTYPPWSSFAGPTQAFDGDIESYWYCGSDLRPGFTHWLKIDLGVGNEKIVTKTRMYYSSPSTALGGKIQGSNNDSTWTDLSSFSHGVMSTWYTDTFSNSTSYRYYRIFLNSGDPSNWWPQINELELYTGGAYVSGKFGRAFNFGGTANYFSIPSSSAYTMDTTNKLTVSAWAYSNTNSNGAAYSRILGHADTDGSYDLDWDHSWGGATFSIMTEDHEYHWATSPTQLNSGQWYHLVGTYDGENVKLYVGGTLVATTPTTGSIHAIASPVTIGASNLIGSFFSGKIDDVTLWNRALSLSEIKSLYDASNFQYNQTFSSLSLGSHTTKSYMVGTSGSIDSTELRTFTFALSATKAITAFDFNTLSPGVTGTIDETAKTVTLNVPFNTDVTTLVPTITFTGTSISPNTGVAQNFTNPVTYTVTAANSSTLNYTVTVLVASGSNNSTSNNNSNNSSNNNSTPICNDEKSSSAPDLFQINTTKNLAKLFFTPISNTNKYVFSFSTKPNAQENGAEVTLAREGVQNYTINLLKPNTIYYFKVRGQNGCMTGDWSNIMQIKTNSQKYFKNIKPIKTVLTTKKVVVVPTITTTKILTPTIIPPQPIVTSAPIKKSCFLWWCN